MTAPPNTGGPDDEDGPDLLDEARELSDRLAASPETPEPTAEQYAEQRARGRREHPAATSPPSGGQQAHQQASVEAPALNAGFTRGEALELCARHIVALGGM